MDQSDLNITPGTPVVSEQVDMPTNERVARLGPDWDIQPGDLAWACNDRDWNDVLCDLVNFAKKPLNLLKRWFRT